MSQMIENSQRGVTLNKALAWTVFAWIVATSFGAGGAMVALKMQGDDNAEAVSRTTAEFTSFKNTFDTRLRAVETDGARQSAMFLALQRSLEDLKTQQRENNRILQDLAARLGATRTR